PPASDLLDVVRRDLIEGAVAPPVVVPAVHQPVVRLWVEEPAVRHRVVADRALRGQDCRQQAEEQRRTRDREPSDRPHRDPPYCWNPGRLENPPAAARTPSMTLSGRAGSRRGAGPSRTRAPSLTSNVEKWHGHLIVRVCACQAQPDLQDSPTRGRSAADAEPLVGRVVLHASGALHAEPPAPRGQGRGGAPKVAPASRRVKTGEGWTGEGWMGLGVRVREISRCENFK